MKSFKHSSQTVQKNIKYIKTTFKSLNYNIIIFIFTLTNINISNSLL